MKKVLLKNTIYVKITAAFLTVVLVLCAVYLYSYITSMNLLKNEKIATLNNAGKSQIQLLDRQLLNIKRAIYNSYATQDWDTLAMTIGSVNDFPTLQQVISAQERVRAIFSSSEILEEVCVHFPQWGRSISTTMGLIEFDREEWENIIMPPDSVGAQIVYHGGDAYLTSRYQLANPEFFSIDAKISFEKCYSMFSDYSMIGVPLNNYLVDLSSGALLQSHENLGTANVFINQRIWKMEFSNDSPVSFVYDGKQYLILTAASSYSNLRIVNVVMPADLVAPFARQTHLVVLFTILVSLSIILVLTYIKRIIVRPIDKMVKAFKPLAKGDFSVNLEPTSNDEFAKLYTTFNQMVENLKILVNEAYEKELLVERANFKQLQSQINPHFLYNSFYALSTMIKIGDNENADLFCMHLAAYFRYITRSGSDMMTLGEEWQHARNYLNIMTMRNSTIQVEFQEDLPDSVNDLKVPRLIVQPLIENAFEHGGKTVTVFCLKVTACCEQDHVVIRVEDNGKGTSDQDLDAINLRLQQHNTVIEITGLINIHKRLKVVFGPESGLWASRSSLGGVCITALLSLKGVDDRAFSNHGC